MALRSGYYGVKKNLLNIITKLSDNKIIKNIGNGLKLTNTGSLSVDIDTDSMKFLTNGKLASKSVGSVKTLIYDGDGLNTRTLVLDNPQVVIGIYEISWHDGFKGFVGAFDTNSTDILCYWFKYGANPGCSVKNVSMSGNNVILTGDSTHIANGSDCTYIIVYI